MASKTLIVYYSLSGTTAKMAQLLQSVTDGELLELKVSDGTFSNDMYKTAEIATQQIDSGELPQLTNQFPDLTAYDTILVGGPVWSAKISTPVQSFLKHISGITAVVAPFYTSTGYNGTYENDFKNMLTKVDVRDGIGMTSGNLQQENQAGNKLSEWWDNLAK